MLSLFSKSSRHLETSPVTSNADTRSCVGARHVSRERRHVSRGRHVSQLRALFSSDGEEVTSVVSDIPGMYGRSCSMVRTMMTFLGVSRIYSMSVWRIYGRYGILIMVAIVRHGY